MADEPKKPVPATSPSLPADRAPTPTTTLIAQLQGVDVDAVEASVVAVRQAWKQGDQSVVADALIAQATALETVAAKFLRIAGGQSSAKIIEIYTGLALRAFEAARKTLVSLAQLREKPKVQTNVQVNVGGRSGEHSTGRVFDSTNEQIGADVG